MMNAKTQFETENLMMSVLGHLVLIAMMVLSFSVVIERAKLVTPNRIEIIELDLKNVKITGDETKLYNTAAPTPEKEAKVDVKTENKQNTENEKIDIKQPTVVENESKDSKKDKTAKKDEVKPEEKTAVAIKRIPESKITARRVVVINGRIAFLNLTVIKITAAKITIFAKRFMTISFTSKDMLYS